MTPTTDDLREALSRAAQPAPAATERLVGVRRVIARRRRARVVGSAVLTLLVAAGVFGVAGPAQRQAQPPAAPLVGILGGWSYVGPIDRAITYKDTSVNLAIPVATKVPLVPWFTAIGKCASGAAICDKVARGSVALAVASTTSAGTINDDKSVTPLIDKRLVYVLRQRGVECFPVGPAGAPSPTASVCDLTNFIDANTGVVLYSTRASER